MKRGSSVVDGFEFKDKYDFADLVNIMKILRGENGCPWDKEQTHCSIRKNFIEETYEVLEAIDNGDPDLLKEELGDVMLQVVFHAEIERQNGGFDVSDVTDGICRKLIIRHPHIFSDVVADTSEQVLLNWDEIKKQQKGHKRQTEAINEVPRILPSLMRSCKVQQRAAKTGFDWPDVSGALEKVHEELQELEEAISEKNPEHCKEELGDLLFAAVNVSRFIGAEPEESLTDACDKFIKRFSIMEDIALSEKINMQEMTLTELDALWNRAKLVL
jgi:tetrapyrrole methylase family protein/MazG family protein